VRSTRQVGSNLANAWVASDKARRISEVAVQITPSECEDVDTAQAEFWHHSTDFQDISDNMRNFRTAGRARYSAITHVECRAYAAGEEHACKKINNWLGIVDAKAPLPMEPGGVTLRTAAESNKIATWQNIPFVHPQSHDYQKGLQCERSDGGARSIIRRKQDVASIRLAIKSADPNSRCKYADPKGGAESCQWAPIRGETFCLIHTPGGREWLSGTPGSDGDELRHEVVDGSDDDCELAT
jgi:hypothetical protein